MKKIVIKAVGIDLDVVSSKNETNIFEYDDLPSDCEIVENVKGDTWIIEVKKEENSFLKKFFGFSGGVYGDATLKISKDIEELSINSVTGDCDCNGITLKKFDIKTVSGDTDINNSSIDVINFSSTSGDLDISKTPCKVIDFKNVSGDLSVDYLIEDFEKVYVKNVSGDCDLVIAGNEKVYVNKKTASGDIYLKGIDVEFNQKRENRIIDFISVSGDLNIELKRIENVEKINKENNKVNENLKDSSNLKEENMVLTIEEKKILELLLTEKITRSFAIELLESIGYTEENAVKFLDEMLGGGNK
ncbi:DUF4097 family beta strand repeat-containing protein [Marinitoga sp. 1138]|uniref:DUF4097 family beta strand repeat-containing protein n=1 Tax=Marinitoga sp. 1138 TaxID=1643334 RepID=UPI001C313EBD